MTTINDGAAIDSIITFLEMTVAYENSYKVAFIIDKNVANPETILTQTYYVYSVDDTEKPILEIYCTIYYNRPPGMKVIIFGKDCTVDINVVATQDHILTLLGRHTKTEPNSKADEIVKYLDPLVEAQKFKTINPEFYTENIMQKLRRAVYASYR
jgi:hypothetical protein